MRRARSPHVSSAQAGLRLLSAALVLCGFAWAQGVPWLARPLVPSVAAPGGPAFTLTVRGAGFVTGAVVRWNNAALPTKFISEGVLQASVPAAAIASAGTASVTVENPGVGAASKAVLFPIGQHSTAVFYNSSSGDPSLAEPFARGDFYGNGLIEVLTAAGFENEQPSIVAPYLGQTDGSFLAGPSSPRPPDSGGVGVGDFNGDGKLDVLLLDQSPGSGQLTGITVLFGNGDGTFTAGPTTQVNVPALVRGVDIGDFNRDGRLDFVGQEGENGPIQVFFGNGDGTFTPGPTTAMPPG
ncbi:MAG: FG-GAP repeat domain-containing protein [Terriglobales bacterium]